MNKCVICSYYGIPSTNVHEAKLLEWSIADCMLAEAELRWDFRLNPYSESVLQTIQYVSEKCLIGVTMERAGPFFNDQWSVVSVLKSSGIELCPRGLAPSMHMRSAVYGYRLSHPVQGENAF